jgi:hypothetical protein
MASSTKLQALVDRFVSELHELFVEQAGNALRSTLGTSPDARGKNVVARRGRRSATPSRSGKRTPEQIASQATKLLRLIADNPGKRSEDLAPLVGVSTKELVGPLKRLLAEKKIKASGLARGTSYAVAARASKKGRGKKAAAAPSAAE